MSSQGASFAERFKMNNPFKLLCKNGRACLLLLMVPVAAMSQSLWKEATFTPIVSDKRAHSVGDIITILVQQSATATKANSTATSKKASIDASISSFLYGPSASGLLTKKGAYPAINTSSDTEFTGSGQINNSEVITDKISVQVIDVLPNANMVVEGSRQTSFSGESQRAVLRGVVRVDDLMANNTVYSYNLAEASIKFISSGTVSDAQNKGWFTRVWDKLTPF
jgi:flagellar L-ring protein precursor FlgH